MWTYRCKVIKVVDGDTVDVDIDLGFGIWQKNERVRIMGIDTPESRTRDKVEKKFGLASKEHLKSLLGKESVLQTTINKKGGGFTKAIDIFTIKIQSMTTMRLNPLTGSEELR